jgi:hypothetical protein
VLSTLALVGVAASACTGSNPAYRRSVDGLPSSDDVPAKEATPEPVMPEPATPEPATPDAAAFETASPDVPPVEASPEVVPEVPPGATTEDRTVVISSATTSITRFGGTGGEPFDQRCPAGQALVGLRSNEHNYVNSADTYLIGLQGVCASLLVPGNGTAVEQTAVTELPWAGRSDSGTTFLQRDLSCPGGHVIVGMVAWWDLPIHVEHIQFHCAPLTVAAGLPGTLSTGGIVSLPITGTSQPTGAEATACPTDQIVVGYVGRAGSRLDAFQLICASPTLP